MVAATSTPARTCSSLSTKTDPSGTGRFPNNTLGSAEARLGGRDVRAWERLAAAYAEVGSQNLWAALALFEQEIAEEIGWEVLRADGPCESARAERGAMEGGVLAAHTRLRARR